MIFFRPGQPARLIPSTFTSRRRAGSAWRCKVPGAIHQFVRLIFWFGVFFWVIRFDTRFEIALTIALYTEWQAVLTRPEHLPPGVTVDAALGFLRYLASVAHLQDVHFLWRPLLRDPDDDMVVECAVSSGSQFIVTHNIKDIRRVEALKVQAMTPADFLRLLRSQP